MQKRIFVSALAVALALMAGVVPAKASTISQRFQESGVPGNGLFDTIEVFVLTQGVTFTTPMQNFGNSGSASIDASWAGTLPNPQYTIATGTETTYIQWDLNLLDSPGGPFDLLFLAYEKGRLLLSETTDLHYNGGWSYPVYAGSLDGLDRSVVPEPVTMSLIGAGMIVLGVCGRKLKPR
jgi:hypothetical protein